jgi:hypothetical protein
MVQPTDHRTADVSGRAAAAAAAAEMAGAYLTDEVFLYRVLGSIASGVDEVVVLEDCYGLDVVRVRAGDLRSRRLRVVTAAVAG